MWGGQSCPQPAFRPAGPARKRVRGLKVSSDRTCLTVLDRTSLTLSGPHICPFAPLSSVFRGRGWPVKGAPDFGAAERTLDRLPPAPENRSPAKGQSGQADGSDRIGFVLIGTASPVFRLSSRIGVRQKYTIARDSITSIPTSKPRKALLISHRRPLQPS